DRWPGPPGQSGKRLPRPGVIWHVKARRRSGPVTGTGGQTEERAVDGSGGPPTIYDVARAAGVSIASVSRGLHRRRHPLPGTRGRVERAVADLGFIPDGAARALSARLKEVVGVVIRRPSVAVSADGIFEDEETSLQFPDLINRGIEVAAQRRDFNLLISSVGLDSRDTRRIFGLARQSDGLILHDPVLDPAQAGRLGSQVPVVTLAGTPTPATVNVSGDNRAGMAELARHLVRDHGYRMLAYLDGHADSPDNLARKDAFGEQVTADGAEFISGPQWQGSHTPFRRAPGVDRPPATRAP